MKEGREPEYPEKNPDELQKKPEDSSPTRDTNTQKKSIGDRLGKQTC